MSYGSPHSCGFLDSLYPSSPKSFNALMTHVFMLFMCWLALYSLYYVKPKLACVPYASFHVHAIYMPYMPFSHLFVWFRTPCTWRRPRVGVRT